MLDRSKAALPTNSGAREAPRAAVACRGRSKATPPTNSGARAASEHPKGCEPLRNTRRGAARTPRAAARAKQLSRMPGNSSSSLTLTRSDRDPRMRLGLQEPTERARAFPQQGAIGPAVTSRACANVTRKPRARGAARPYSHAPSRHYRTAPKALRRAPRSKFATPLKQNHSVRGAISQPACAAPVGSPPSSSRST
jgi:hypothetical protein